jgi:hypothetical protein
MILKKKKRHMKNIILVIFISTFIQSCATTYQKSGFTGGYSETQLDVNLFKVSFIGNGYTGRERVTDFTLLRSAELALKNGYQYFAIIDSNNYTSRSSRTTPISFHTTGSAYGGTVTTTTGGKTYHTSKPSSSNTIICFKKKPEKTFSYSANFIRKSITEKYGIKKEVKDKKEIIKNVENH